MRNKYKVETTKEFDKRFAKLVKKDKSLLKSVGDTLEQMSKDPFYRGLRTHKVMTKNYGTRYSSRVTGDLRVIWDFGDKRAMIQTFTLGGHEGGKRVYK